MLAFLRSVRRSSSCHIGYGLLYFVQCVGEAQECYSPRPKESNKETHDMEDGTKKTTGEDQLEVYLEDI